MASIGLVLNVLFAVVNLFFFMAAYNKYTHAVRTLEDTRRIALRVLLIKKRS